MTETETETEREFVRVSSCARACECVCSYFCQIAQLHWTGLRYKPHISKQNPAAQECPVRANKVLRDVMVCRKYKQLRAVSIVFWV